MSVNFNYPFTHDLRTTVLLSEVTEYAELIYKNQIENLKSSKNVSATYASLFNLESDTNCNFHARNGDPRKVILNFVKKFQYPNYWTEKTSTYEVAYEEGIKFSPLKETLKLLYIGYINEGSNSYFTLTEILNFLFFNEDVAKKQHPNYVKVYEDILSSRNDNSFLNTDKFENILQDDDLMRRIREMLNILPHTGFVKQEGINKSQGEGLRKYSLCEIDDLTIENKADLHDILKDDNFWDGNNEEEFKKYFDLPTSTKQSYLIPEHINAADTLEDPEQKIYFGPPGTGKSYNVTQFIKSVYPNYGANKESHPCVYRVMIHPEYSYFDFIGSILPVSKTQNGNNEISYEFVNGIFVQSLITALSNKEYDIFLVLEEMSRGNIVAIFGELFQLLDRDSDGYSEYSVRNSNISAELKKYVSNWNSEDFYLPKNLHILGTVNTSDQNVFVMDTAFKRRFDFEYISTDPVKESNSDNPEYENKFELIIYKESINDSSKMDWNTFYPILNEFIIDKLDLNEDKQIGQFFIKFKKGEDDKINTYNYNQIKNKLFQYLWNDIHLIKLTNSNLFSNAINSFGKLYSIDIENEGLGVCFSQEFSDYLDAKNPNRSL